ncbi:hypothetical protein TW95_gp0940 [Pandoravirus inopinatum]|uniref:Uncharacterized protein n=1 Tax=Pandoravirus inopinatum TaxID=1605721 RepID=A0A0B5J2C0_9VIRU|nr:hypothetical protein TW95_gp0940 [Pandoravirus inopinatum]AJF97674.1 hypothetical protein [Pandoravirus inopinatum]
MRRHLFVVAWSPQPEAALVSKGVNWEEKERSTKFACLLSATQSRKGKKSVAGKIEPTSPCNNFFLRRAPTDHNITRQPRRRQGDKTTCTTQTDLMATQRQQ